MALTVFLMQARRRAYRDAFLDYVRDAYRGRIKRGTGRSLEDRLGQPLRELEAQFREFLDRAAKSGDEAERRSRTMPASSRTARRKGSAIASPDATSTHSPT